MNLNLNLYREDTTNEVGCESFVDFSEDHCHDAFAVKHSEGETLKELHRRGMTFDKVIKFSDGCGRQYKSKSNFKDTSMAETQYRVKEGRHYFGTRHGKGPCNAEKKLTRKDVMRKRAIISDQATMYTYAQKRLTKREPLK